MQVSFHKTVAALEWLLADVISALLAEKIIECAADDVFKMIDEGQWQNFDDSCLLEKIKAFSKRTDISEVNQRKSLALLNRQTPSLVAEYEAVLDSEKNKKEFDKLLGRVKKKVVSLSAEHEIPSDYWHVWSKKRSLTAIGGDVSKDPEKAEKAAKAVRIVGNDSRVSTPIISYEPSLMSVLGNYELFAVRVYVMLDRYETDTRPKLREMISKSIKDEISDVTWKN